MDKLLEAIKFAKEKHKGQLDDSGKDYFEEHLNKVGHAIQMLTTDEDIICAAYLHDVLEDTDTTYDEVLDEFGYVVATLVHECTHEGQKDSYGFYFPRLESEGAILIKLIDRASNISRMDSWPRGRREQYLKRTKFWKSESPEQNQIVKKEVNVKNEESKN